MTKLAYIGGYGRSGSTLLEYLLTVHPEIVACGEVKRHLRRFGRRKTCTCGSIMKDCPVWSPFQHKKGKLKGWDHEQLTPALLEHVSPDYAVMIDSSKTAWGTLLAPFRLRRRLGKDLLLVHLVRDPRGVCWSVMRTTRPPTKARKNLPASLRAALGWTWANLASEMFGRLYPTQYVRLRYEDIVRARGDIIGEVLKRLDLRPPPDLDTLESYDNRHQLYGNTMRFRELSELKEDVEWRTSMPTGARRMVTVLCWPLGAMYGYFGS